jgi:hypothetical protein
MSETAVVIPGRTSASVFDASNQVPALYAPDAPAAKRAFEFFAVNIRNPNTRKAYARAAAGPPRRGRRHPNEHRLPQLPCHRHHRIPA